MRIPRIRFVEAKIRAITQFSERRGSVLLLVLVIVPLMALGAYSFTHWMRAESRAAVVSTKQIQVRWLAQGGIDRARALLALPANQSDPLDLVDNPSEFAAQPVMTDQAGNAGLFTILAPDGDGNNVRYGLEDECAKIPLHNQGLGMKRENLMGLEGMTEQIADAILDWIDADDDSLEYGAEADYYLSSSTPYQPRNGVPKTVGELLMVKGVTPYLLFGEDVNLDGILNPNEDDGDESWPPDNRDGTLQRGWHPYLTFVSADAPLNSLGEPKINIKTTLGEEDRSTVTEAFGEEFVVFLASYQKEKGDEFRALSDLIDATVEIDDPSQEQNQQSGGQSGQGGGSPTLEAAPSQSQTPTPTPSPPGGGGGNDTGGGGGAGTGGGQGGRESEKKKITLRSPWTSGNVSQYLPTAMEELTVSTEPVRKGVINVNVAPAAVLMALPSITEELADKIATAAADKGTSETTPAWMLVDGVLDLETFRKVEPFVTAQGKVFRVESVGFFENGGPVVRMEAWIDATSSVPTVLRKQDLTSQGSYYPRDVLMGTQSY